MKSIYINPLSILCFSLLILLIAACSDHSENTESSGADNEVQLSDKVETSMNNDLHTPSEKSTVNNEPVKTDLSETKEKILIIYFSHAGNDYEVDAVSSASLLRQDEEGYIGNTEVVAKAIQEAVGGDLIFVETVSKYASDDRLVHDEGLSEAKSNARPEISVSIEDISQYDTIFIGYPLWWYDMPMAMYSFIETYDLSGKTIHPFVTHNGSGLGKSVKNLSKSLSDSKVSQGLTISLSQVDAASDLVSDWLNELGMSNE